MDNYGCNRCVFTWSSNDPFCPVCGELHTHYSKDNIQGSYIPKEPICKKEDITKEQWKETINNVIMHKTIDMLVYGKINKHELLDLIHNLCKMCNDYQNLLMELAKCGIHTENNTIKIKNPLGFAGEKLNEGDMVYFKSGQLFKMEE